MKKHNFIIGIFLLCCLALFSLTGCDSADYKKAEALYQNGDYAAALELYSSLDDYEDSSEKAVLCQKSLHADNDFLSTIEESVLYRMNNASTKGYDELVNTELAYLERFADASFYDKDLQKIAQQYIEGLHLQHDTLGSDIQYYNDQISWLEGLVQRSQALAKLHSDYGFLADNAQFETNYIRTCEENMQLLQAYNEINRDIDEQVEADSIVYDFSQPSIVSFVVKNNTDYTFSLAFDYICTLVENDLLFYSGSVNVTHIQPGNSYVVSAYYDPSHCSEGAEFMFNWEYRFIDVSI